MRRATGIAACLAVLALGACGTAERVEAPMAPRPADVRRSIVGLLPATLADRAGWATDLYAALTALDLPATAANVCAVLAVTEQESTFRADPPVPGLPAIAWREINERAESAGVPRLAVRAALALPSTDGRSHADRIDAVTTERQLSEIYEDLIGRVPLGRTLLARSNPVRTGGPMQVSIVFAEALAEQKPYPYPVAQSIRREVFTRRGGLYFGAAHLLAYEAPYPEPLYRFADFNAGRWASRNAAFQNAVSVATGNPLALDGDLLPADPDAPPGATERAAMTLAERLDMGSAAIRRDLRRGDGPGFERSTLHERVFALADKRAGQPLPRAVLPRIQLKSPKITRRLTTEWFARRVNERHQRCMGRAG